MQGPKAEEEEGEEYAFSSTGTKPLHPTNICVT
jgi:hypothetical protein